jgi:spore coat polysaccharide biosynthesis protein SpsF
MLKTLGIVEVRSEAGPAGAKFGRKLGGTSLLELVVRRVTDCQRLDKVVVVPADARQAESIRPLVPHDVSIYAPSHRDALGRFAATMEHYAAASAVRVGADHPFVDPVLIDRLVSTADAHPNCDYIGYCRADGRPAILTQLGVSAEWVSAQAMLRAHDRAKRLTERDHVTSFLYGHPEMFNVRLVPLPAELDRDDLRLKIDFEEDWEHAQVLYDALGHDEWDWQRITDLLDSQPALRTRMAVLNRTRLSV